MNPALSRLSATNLRELVRDPTTFFFLLIFPFLFLGLFAFISSTQGASDNFDGFRFGVPAVLILAFGQLALFGTATTMVQLRSRGTLRLLSLTPLRRSTFVASLVPGRLLIAASQLAVLATVAAITGFLEPGQLGRLIVSCLLGLGMLFAFGFFMGGRISSPEVASGGLSAVLPILLIASGVLVPLRYMPAALQDIAHWIPLTYLGDAIRQDLIGDKAMHAIWLDWLIIAGTAMVFVVLAILTFRWDEGDQ